MKPSGVNIKESVSPHKLTLLVLIREYCLVNFRGLNTTEYSDVDWTFTEAEKRAFMILLLKLLQSVDTSLAELIDELNGSNLEARFLKRVEEKLEDFSNDEDGLVNVMDYMQSLTTTLLTAEPPRPSLISKSSLIGLFIRRMVLSFDCLSFSEVVSLCRQFQDYYGQWRRYDQDLGESLELPQADSGPDLFGGASYSRRQAEFFVARQAHLLQHNQSEAHSPSDLQQRIQQLLTYNPNFAEAHYLSYMNQLRVGEYCSAVNSLYHYFDRHILPDTGSKSKEATDDNRAFRYAALNLAALHCHFGHRTEARAALHEAVKMAQETNDTVCLQHALGWLHRLGDTATASTANMMDRSVGKAEKLSLWYLTSLNVQSLSKHNAVSGAQPSSVFDYLMKSDILNCQHSINDLMSLSYTQKASLWSVYGARELSSICSQTLLHLNTGERGVAQQTESEQLALCQLVTHLARKGMYSEAKELLQILKKTSSGFADPWWMICEQEVNFDLAVHRGRWQEAQECAENIAVYDKSESVYRHAILLRHKEQAPKAIEILQKLLDNKENPPEFSARITLLLAELYCQTGNHHIALTHALNSLTSSKRHFLGYWQTLSKLVLASIQYCLGLPQQAHALLESCLVEVFSQTSVFDQGRALFLYAKVQASMTARESADTRKKGLSDSIGLFNKALEKFKRAENHAYMKETVYYKAVIYNELGYTVERNKCSLEFRQMDYQQPSCRGFVF